MLFYGGLFLVFDDAGASMTAGSILPTASTDEHLLRVLPNGGVGGPRGFAGQLGTTDITVRPLDADCLEMGARARFPNAMPSLSFENLVSCRGGCLTADEVVWTDGDRRIALTLPGDGTALVDDSADSEIRVRPLTCPDR